MKYLDGNNRSLMYEENQESINLWKQNEIALEIEHSITSTRKAKWSILKRALKQSDYHFFIRELRIKTHKRTFYANEGNARYHRLIDDFPKSIVGSKVAVYTCIVGDYDLLYEPKYTSEAVDYLAFTDQEISADSKWTKVDITKYEEYYKLSSKELNRKIKIMPHVYLSEYDYTIYIDGNIQIIADLLPLLSGMSEAIVGLHTHALRDCAYLEGATTNLIGKSCSNDVARQFARYRKEGFPEHFGLFQNSVIVRRNKPDVSTVMEQWWKEYMLERTRDQLSLPYVLWRNDIEPDKVNVLGSDVLNNPRFRIHEHR